jgi:hypothetical protein
MTVLSARRLVVDSDASIANAAAMNLRDDELVIATATMRYSFNPSCRLFPQSHRRQSVILIDGPNRLCDSLLS